MLFHVVETQFTWKRFAFFLQGISDSREFRNKMWSSLLGQPPSWISIPIWGLILASCRRRANRSLSRTSVNLNHVRVLDEVKDKQLGHLGGSLDGLHNRILRSNIDGKMYEYAADYIGCGKIAKTRLVTRTHSCGCYVNVFATSFNFLQCRMIAAHYVVTDAYCSTSQKKSPGFVRRSIKTNLDQVLNCSNRRIDDWHREKCESNLRVL